MWILRPGSTTAHRHRGQAVPRNPPVPSTPVPPAPSTRVGPGVLLASPNSAVRYKILPAQLLGGDNGTKLSLHIEKAPNRAISGEQGEFCTGSGAVRLVLGEFCTAHAVGRGVLGEFCTAHAVRGGVLGEFCTEAARRGSCWARFVSPWHLPCVQLPGFRHPPAPNPDPRPLQRARHWWRWGFCAMRSPLAACRRRVAPLHGAIPPVW